MTENKCDKCEYLSSEKRYLKGHIRNIFLMKTCVLLIFILKYSFSFVGKLCKQISKFFF